MTNIEKLIDVVTKHPILYDLSHEHYKNVRKKDKIWDEIGLELNETAEYVKKRWKSLRDTYAKYLKSSKTKTGQAAKKRKLIWAEHMRYFQPFLAFAKTSSNIGFIDASMDYKNDDITLDYNITEICETGSLSEPGKYRLETSTPLQENFSNSSLINETLQSRSNKKKAKTQKPSSVNEVIDYLKTKNKVEYDEIDCTMLAHAKAIKKFSPKRQSLIKFKIAKLIMEQETLHFEELPPSNSAAKIRKVQTQFTSIYEAEFIDIEEYDNFVPNNNL